MRYEVPIRCTCGNKKIIFYVIIDEAKSEIDVVYKSGEEIVGSASLSDIIIQILKSRVYIRD